MLVSTGGHRLYISNNLLSVKTLSAKKNLATKGERPKSHNVCRSDAFSWAEHMADEMDIGPVEHTVRGGANHNIQVLVRVRPPNSRELDQVSAVLEK